MAGLMLLLAWNWWMTALKCGTDTSYCAFSQSKDGVYAGTLRDQQGRLLAHTRFSVAFESRRNAEPRLAGPFVTDGSGGYCIVWAHERITPFAYFDTYGGSGTSMEGAWEPMIPPRTCQRADEGVPWDRADDATADWRFLLTEVLGALAAVLLVAGNRRLDAPGAVHLRRAGVTTAASALVLSAVLVW